MTKNFERIAISYQQHRDTGLLCAFSEDLRGLMVFADTPEQLSDKTLRACEDLVEAITGERHCYQWDDGQLPEFVNPTERLGELIPCQ